jgi:hypothetical protein
MGLGWPAAAIWWPAMTLLRPCEVTARVGQRRLDHGSSRRWERQTWLRFGHGTSMGVGVVGGGLGGGVGGVGW